MDRTPMQKLIALLVGLASLTTLSSWAIAQDKSDDELQWPSLAGDNRIIATIDRPVFIIDERRLEKSDLNNPLGIERCRGNKACRLFVADFFSDLSGQFGIKKSVVRSGVLMHHYPDVLVNGHNRGTGTYVFFLPKQNLFYLWGECYMNHLDEVLGPYANDPRIVLPKSSLEKAR